MGNIILNLAVTLDGYIEGPNGEIDWCIMEDDMDFERFLASIDTILYGRISYEAWGNYKANESTSPEETAMWKAIHSKKKYVFSSTKKTDPNATYISRDIAENIMKMKEQQGKEIWLYGGAGLIAIFLEYGQ